jgi:DNA-binding CsgD family transcriptional regulator
VNLATTRVALDGEAFDAIAPATVPSVSAHVTSSLAPALLGRQDECRGIDHVLSDAFAGRGGAMVMHGEPGIGKSTLLSYAIDSADGWHVLRAVGNEAEKELPYAAARQMCEQSMPVLDELPGPQRDALVVALGHAAGPAPDRLFVGLALLGLFVQLSASAPVLCVIDDAQWLDQESALAFAIVARRLASHRIAFLFGARTVPSDLVGLPGILVEGLGPRDARNLLCSALPDPFDEHVLDRIVAETRGNPLALLELPRGLTPAELAGGFAVPASGPVARRVEASFRRRIDQLSTPSRLLLLVAAAEPTGDPVTVWQAAQSLEVDESAADSIEADHLLEMAPRVIFRHPLVRSAVYQAASPEERRAVHEALAQATDARVDPDRRAWHRAQAAWHPDDEVATELEASAARAQARGGFAAAATFLARAAELTVDLNQRVARTLAAAEAKRRAGALESALEVANRIEWIPLDDHQRAQIEVLRARVSFDFGRARDAPRLLLVAAQHLAPHDPQLARETFLDALSAALYAGELANGGHARDVAKAALVAPPPSEPSRASDLLLHSLALLIAEGPAAGTQVAQRALEVFRDNAITTEERLRWSWLAARAALFIWDYDTWDELTLRQIEVARAAGAFVVLPFSLATRAVGQIFAGQLSDVEALVAQGEAVADATDIKTVRYAALSLAAFRGRDADVQQLIDANVEDFASRGAGMGVTLTRWARAVLWNGLGRHEDAYLAADEALENPYEVWFWPWATVELIEAATRTGRLEAATLAFERLTESTSSSGTAWGSAIEHRCRALVSEGDLAESAYWSAIETLKPTQLRLDLARTHLLFGEWLRRGSRSADAREQLRAAHGLFTEFGSENFAKRALSELRATGDRMMSLEATHELTAQEMRVAQLVSRGSTNAEVARQMFVSPSTVEYHLHKIFRKLGVRKRTELTSQVVQAAQDAKHEK